MKWTRAHCSPKVGLPCSSTCVRALVTSGPPRVPVLAKNSSQHESRRFANVSVGPKTLATEGRQEVWGLKPTDFRELNHPSQFRSLDGSRLGRVADERQVTARPVVVRKVPTKDTT
jgi:hypothetical protein